MKLLLLLLTSFSCLAQTFTGSGSFIGTTNPTDGLVLWFKLDDGSGVIALDSSGSGNNGTLYNSPVWSSGKNGGALYFNGSNYVTNSGDGTYAKSATNVSVCFWVCPTNTTPANFNAITGNTDNADGTSGGYLVIIDNRTGRVNNVWAQFGRVGGFSQIGLNANTLSTNNWNHVAISYGSSIVLYTNGVLCASSAVASAFKPSSGLWGIGALAGSLADNKIAGWIDDVRVYARSINSTEVLQLYNNGRGQ